MHQHRKSCLGVALMVCRWSCLKSARTRLLALAFLVSQRHRRVATSESSRVEFRVVRRPALVSSHNRLNAMDLGSSRGNATARVLDTFWQIFRNFSFHLERSRCLCFPRSATIHVVQSVIQLRNTGQLKFLRRRSPWGNGSSMSTAFRLASPRQV